MSPTFDDQAAVYERWFATPLGRLVDAVEKRAVFSLTPEVQGRQILEIGCGTGNFSLALTQWYSGLMFPSAQKLSSHNENPLVSGRGTICTNIY
jgi:ubiquinone/menaquinone biosynthesis C-methylase UbiE